MKSEIDTTVRTLIIRSSDDGERVTVPGRATCGGGTAGGRGAATGAVR
jgi:hypothetical protein